MDISTASVLNITLIDTMARAILGSATSGVSVSTNTRIHLTDSAQANQDKASALLAGVGALTVSADKTTMTEGDADPVVTCNDALISGDSTIGYLVLLDGALYASGTDSVTAGTAQLTLVSPAAGVYTLTIYRLSSAYQSGSVTITVNEV